MGKKTSKIQKPEQPERLLDINSMTLAELEHRLALVKEAINGHEVSTSELPHTGERRERNDIRAWFRESLDREQERLQSAIFIHPYKLSHTCAFTDLDSLARTMKDFEEKRMAAKTPKGKMLQAQAEAKRLVGKRLIGIDLKPYKDAGGRKHFDPTLTFEDGTTLTFKATEQSDAADYGIEPRFRRSSGPITPSK